jgi:hypothetical protein
MGPNPNSARVPREQNCQDKTRNGGAIQECMRADSPPKRCDQRVCGFPCHLRIPTDQTPPVQFSNSTPLHSTVWQSMEGMSFLGFVSIASYEGGNQIFWAYFPLLHISHAP